ncbi:MAG TPA: PadR family transcriptional regulator [Gemmatimonadaceae bacterium]|nr:PadR family transcriptional regulator [Gemmatimonadaceae bacterium]
MPPQPNDRLQGTLDLLILKLLRREPMHGWGIAQQIQQSSRDVLQINQGSLYPALHRLEERGWIAAEWGSSENNRRARYYKLTALGRRQLEQETASWEEFVLAVTRVLRTA